MPPDVGTDHHQAYKMLKYKKQNGNNRTAERNKTSAATMSVFATVSPTTATCNPPPPPSSNHKCSNTSDKTNEKTNSGGDILRTTSIKTIVPTKMDHRKAEEEDKYPCLRRALSCTETPILPLGTYAVEFGFDVSTLPFVRSSRLSASSTLFGSGYPSERVPASNLEAALQQPQSFKRILSPAVGISKESYGNHNHGFSTNSYSSTSLYHNLASCSYDLTTVSNNGETEISTKTGGTQTMSLQRVSKSVSSQTSENDNHHHQQQQFLLSSNRSFKPFEINSSRNFSNLSQSSILETTNPLITKLQYERPYASETSTFLKIQDDDQTKIQTDCEKDVDSKNKEDENECESDGSVSKELYYFCSRGLIAKSFKKDNRTWLWKSSSKIMPVDDDEEIEHQSSDVERPVAKRWKKDERAWLWKTSKKDEEGEDEEDLGEEKKEKTEN